MSSMELWHELLKIKGLNIIADITMLFTIISFVIGWFNSGLTMMTIYSTLLGITLGWLILIGYYYKEEL